MECRIAGTDSLLVEIGAVVMHAVDEDRSELNAEEIEFIKRITKRMVKETKMQLGEIAHLLPEEIPQETVDQILRENGGAY
jgi:hypothetical protein